MCCSSICYAFAVQPHLLRTIDVFLEGASKPLLVVLGQTASGKTDFSLELADYVHGEIINADSRQLYRFLDIGTAKIRSDETRGIPHHLFSVLDPKEEVTVAWYQKEATKIIEDILSHRKVPILVGGSMLYISSIIDGLTLAPPADPAVRKALEQEYDKDGGLTLYRRLQEIDPESAETIHPHNKPYVVRAVEICEIMKKPKSHVVGEKKTASYDILLIGVKRLKGDLKKRIAERVDTMFRDGWMEEVQSVLSRGYRASDPALKSHGYREIIEYLDEIERSGSDPDLETMQTMLKKKIASKTSQYAKRQMTWWGHDERIHWVSV
jgi:tRNA dimethylallyltransferase